MGISAIDTSSLNKYAVITQLEGKVANECPKCQTKNPDESKFCMECAAPLPQKEEVVHTKTLETPTEELKRGSVFAGRYEIIEELGKGGMGKVYRVEDMKVKEEIALKLIKPEIAADKKTIERFRNELTTARKISHRNICRMFDLGEERGQHFITMEYVTGQDLKGLIRQSAPLSIPRAISIAKQICDGLTEAHSLGVAHRDLKPNNIMIDRGGNAKIMDFGIARSLEAKGITGTGVIIGTPEYMSPEQVEGKEVDHRSDIYSLGIVLYEMLTGRVPFEGDTPFDIGIKHKSEVPLNPKELNIRIPENLSYVIMKCLEKDKIRRFQSAGEVQSELNKIQERIPITVKEIQSRKSLTSKEITVTFGLKKLVMPILLVLASAILIVVVLQVIPQKEKEPSIAVLPFEDLSESQDQGWFCDGMTDEIISKLSSLEGLKVIPRTTMMSYKGKDLNLNEIGQELNAKTILEGSIRKEKDDIRVTATLIEWTKNSQLWSNIYNRKLESIFEIQSDIAEKIASALITKLSPQEKEKLIKRHTGNLEAYNYYLIGLEYYYRRGKDDNENAIASFNRALEIDPNYALAYAGLGNAYTQRTLRFGFPNSWINTAVEVSLKAISIDPSLPEAYKALGLAYETKRWYRKAKTAYEKAIELNPNFVDAFSNLTMVCYNTGEYDRALTAGIRGYSLSIGGEKALLIFRIGRSYLYLNEYTEAEKWFQRSIEIEPGITFATQQAYDGLVYLYLLQGNFQEARKQVSKIFSIDPNNIRGLRNSGLIELWSGDFNKAEQIYSQLEDNIHLGYILWKKGQKDEAKKLFSQSIESTNLLLDQGNEQSNLPYNLAIIYSIKGNMAEAYKWLEHAVSTGFKWYAWIELDPLMENFHNDEQFKQIISQIEIEVEEMRKRVIKE